MNKLFKLTLSIISVVATLAPLSACEHEHKFGEWYSDGHEHWRQCAVKGCKYLESGEHVGYPCEVCGPTFNAVAFYTGINDEAHVSFCAEANQWFEQTATEYNFTYTSTTDWTNMNDEYLANYDLVIFLDTRPEDNEQRAAFERYMKGGGAWLGFHFSAFALDNSSYPQNWDWYHDEFLGSGEYVSNTWEPTTAVLQVETHDHYSTVNMPETFVATECEWYRWEHDLRENEDITILASVHPSSFPLGTGPKEYEIWHSGYYPVVWSNNNYNMVYMNMGHNLVEYGKGITLSYTFDDPIQNTLILDSMFGMTAKF